MADAADSNMVGKLFFNIVQIKCFVLVSCNTGKDYFVLFFFISLTETGKNMHSIFMVGEVSEIQN